MFYKDLENIFDLMLQPPKPWPRISEEELTPKDGTIELELPGVDKKEISISTETREGYSIITIKGMTRRETPFTRVYKYKGYDIDKAKATLKDGLLTVHIPKTEKPKWPKGKILIE